MSGTNENLLRTLGPNLKERTNAAAYVGLYPFLRDVAARHGYALAVHGSMARDFDLVAIPWTESASSHDELLAEFLDGFGLKLATEPQLTKQDKPHGRLCYILYFGDGGPHLDLSIMPRIK